MLVVVRSSRVRSSRGGVTPGRGDWGEMYAQAIDATGVDYGTLRREVWVSGSVELCLRKHNLSWSHHQAVAPLPEGCIPQPCETCLATRRA